MGVYDRSHLERLRLIARLQDRGYSLAGIRDLLDAWESGRTLGTVLGQDVADAVVLDETPTALTLAALESLLPEMSKPAMRGRLERAGLFVVVDGQYIVRSMALLRLVSEATKAGVPITEAVGLVSEMRDGATSQARSLVTVLVSWLWDPDRDNRDTEMLARRVRILIAQAAASLVVAEVGRLVERAGETAEGRGLAELLDALRVGATVEQLGETVMP